MMQFAYRTILFLDGKSIVFHSAVNVFAGVDGIIIQVLHGNLFVPKIAPSIILLSLTKLME